MTSWWSRLRRAVRGPPTIDWHAEAARQAEMRCLVEAEADGLRATLQRAAVALRQAEELLHGAADAASATLRATPPSPPGRVVPLGDNGAKRP
jgi:hypothetical protein